MKKTLLALALAGLSVSSYAQQNFTEVLQKTFTTFDSTRNTQLKMDQSNKLGLISKKWADEWSAHYYNALSKAILSYEEKDEAKRDAYLDEGDRELAEAIALLKKETDETYVLAALLANARLAVKPQARWQKYGKLFEDNLAKAKELNPDNPRIYYLQGNNKLFTPKMFGGGKKAALPYYEKAQTLFAKENSNDIQKPYWGKQANEFFMKQAQGED